MYLQQQQEWGPVLSALLLVLRSLQGRRRLKRPGEEERQKAASRHFGSVDCRERRCQRRQTREGNGRMQLYATHKDSLPVGAWGLGIKGASISFSR